jgi:hypothetical protein
MIRGNIALVEPPATGIAPNQSKQNCRRNIEISASSIEVLSVPSGVRTYDVPSHGDRG